jgi:site-specific DNA recombinase
MPRITTIGALPTLERKKRVAGYSRVSSGKDAMLHSLSSQVSYFSTLIQAHDDWVYAGVYADEAKTGTKENRPEFQRLITDCRAGKIEIKALSLIQKLAA